MTSFEDESLTRKTSSYWGSLADVLCDHVERFVGPNYVYTAVCAYTWRDLDEKEKTEKKINLQWNTLNGGVVFSSFDKARNDILSNIVPRYCQDTVLEYYGNAKDQQTIIFPGYTIARPPEDDIVIVLARHRRRYWNSTFYGILKIPVK